MQEPQPDSPWLLEICPASTLKKRDLYQSSYKGKGQQKREARVRILEALERREGLVVPQETRAQLIEDDGGDALDSVVAALAVSEALRHPDFPTVEHHSAYAVEGYIYV
jgi:ribosomal protein S12 methylthiotransferase accessory factor YcaO